jgi:transcriptional regulator with XRE-family HTH domain
MEAGEGRGMAKKKSQFIDRLEAVLQKMKSAELARLLGVSDSRIPEWRRGRRLPPPDTLIKLGKLALERGLGDPFFFWALAGVDTQTLRRMAGNVHEEQYRTAGPTVPVPRFRYTESGREEAGPPVPLPAEFIPNVPRTICVLVDRASTAFIRAPSGLFILDTSLEGTQDLRALWDRVVIVGYAPRGPYPEWKEGMYAGRLMLSGGRGGEGVTVHAWVIDLSDPALPSLRFGRHTEAEALKGIARGDREAEKQPIVDAVKRAESEITAGQELYVFGEVIGRLSGHIKR